METNKQEEVVTSIYPSISYAAYCHSVERVVAVTHVKEQQQSQFRSMVAVARVFFKMAGLNLVSDVVLISGRQSVDATFYYQLSLLGTYQKKSGRVK